MNRIAAILAAGGLSMASSAMTLGQAGKIEVDLLEEQSNEPLICRVQITDARGRPQRARGALFDSDWNLVEAVLDFRGRAGDYRYKVHHGPEYASASGQFTLDRQSEGLDVVRLPRHANLADEGWFGGDLFSRVPAPRSLRWLPAEGLSMAAVMSNDQVESPSEGSADLGADSSQRWVESTTYQDARLGSGLLFHHWLPPAQVPDAIPSGRLLVMAKQADPDHDQLSVHTEIQRLWARDVPIWLASERVDSIQLLSDHLTIDGKAVGDFSPTMMPEGRFRGPRALGRIAEQLYWQVLETGLRIPPTAGSGFGRGPNPLGYNRVYAKLEPSVSRHVSRRQWWEAVRAGRTFVTSGPLLRAEINGRPPGEVFSAPTDGSVDLQIALTLTVSDPVEYLDVIFNGKSLYQTRLDEYAKEGGKIPLQSLDESGWLVVRVVTERDFTYRIATTAPYYVEVGGKPRISRSAVEFFLAWLDKTQEQIRALDAASREAAEPYVESAKRYWQQRLESANAE